MRNISVSTSESWHLNEFSALCTSRVSVVCAPHYMLRYMQNFIGSRVTLCSQTRKNSRY